jgi:hypothetical protein
MVVEDHANSNPVDNGAYRETTSGLARMRSFFTMGRIGQIHYKLAK